MADSKAEIVIVGAGIIGLSIAYQLARRGAGRIMILEKAAAVAEGSTGASSAVLRQRYSNPEMIRLARDGLRAYSNWSEFTGLSEPRAVYQRTGMIWMVGDTPEAAAAHAELMRNEGIDAEVLDAAELQRRFPALAACSSALDLSGATEHECADGGPFLFERDAGYTDPVGAAQDLLEAALREGVELRLRQRVTSIRRSGGRITGVDLAGGCSIDSPLVINAAGPWCNQLNSMAGIKVPWTLSPMRVQVLHRDRPTEIDGPLPVVADTTGGIYLRPEGRGQQILIGAIEEEHEVIADPDDFQRGVDPEYRETKILGLHHRLPALPHRGRVTGLAGLYTVNEEDVHPILGPTELDGFLVANGFSGHGFKLAPMIGSQIAQSLTGKRARFDTDVPIDYLRVDREPITVQSKTAVA